MPEITHGDTKSYCRGVAMGASDVETWFVREVLPLEALLMQYLRHHWPEKSQIEDLRQDVYVRICEFAQKEIPDPAKPFILATARNLIIDRLRREQIVPIEIIADIDLLGLAADTPGPERSTVARDELRRLQAALDSLPPRCREAVALGKIDGLSGREIATRMAVSEATVSEHIDKGMCVLADVLYGEFSVFGKTP